MTVPITTRVVVAVSEERCIDYTDLPPLDEVVDTDALNAIFDREENGHGGHDLEVQFTYADRRISIRDGAVTVRRRNVSPPSPAEE